MLAVLTVRGLAILRHGTAAPLWRLIVTPENTVWLNLAAALVVALCFAYTMRKLVFRGQKGVSLLTGPWKWPVFVFVCVPFFVIPGLADEIVTLSPFYFSLMPGAIALALTASQREDLEGSLVSANMRTFLAGLFAAVGVWEGLAGLVLAVVVFLLSFRFKIRHERSATRVLVLWTLGFVLGFAFEGVCLGWPWAAIRPLRPPFVGLAVFLFVVVAPLALVRVFGTRWWLMLVWGLPLLVMTVNALVAGKFWRDGATERFVRKVLADLGERKIIIGDNLTDILFDELKPSDVRLVGSHSFEDREFLISIFDTNEPVQRRALVVRDYYHLPEMEEVAEELGLRFIRPDEKTQAGKQATKPKAPTVISEAMRAQAVTNEMRRIEKLAQPIVTSINEMMVDFAKIPAAKRKAKIEEARDNIRRGWKTGFAGEGMSLTVLTLDLMLNDWAGAESDALTALTIDREDQSANAVLGNIRLRKGELDKAERYLRKGVVGGGIGAYNDLAILLLKTNRAKEAEGWARKAVAKAPKDWNCHETLVQVLIALEETMEAQKHLSEVERLAKEQKQFELIKDAVNRDRASILRQRGRFANEQWGQDKSDRWGE